MASAYRNLLALGVPSQSAVALLAAEREMAPARVVVGAPLTDPWPPSCLPDDLHEQVAACGAVAEGAVCRWLSSLSEADRAAVRRTASCSGRPALDPPLASSPATPDGRRTALLLFGASAALLGVALFAQGFRP